MSFIKLFCVNNFIKSAKSRIISNRYVFTNHLRFCSESLLNINTNISKDVILFKYENPKYFKYLTFFGLSQYCFWIYLSHFSYTSLRDTPIAKEDNVKDLPWWRKVNLGDQKYRNGISMSCGIIGHMFLLLSFAYTIRSVRYLVLRKGGKTLSFVTYGPFGLKNSILNVPVTNVSASESRSVARVQLPVRVQGKWFHYMLDMRGEFCNPSLFDSTAGLRRSLRSQPR